MYFVLVARVNISPGTGMEFLNRIGKLIKDYCGQLSEEAIRRNLVLVYELIDEVMVCVFVV